MSFNIMFNKQKHENKIIENYSINSMQKKLNNQQDINPKKNSTIKNSTKISVFFKNKNDSLNLDHLYKNSIFSLENTKKEVEKNIFSNNNIKEINNKNFQDLLLKKNS